ncbi:MAG TPA: nuclear transport factor 2 family protein [Longimicrobiales bacterium]
MDEELTGLLDKDQVAQVITRLFVGTDERDWAGVRACFAERVHFDMTSLAGGEPADLSPDEITAGWQQGLAPLAAVHHQMGNLLVHVHGQEAEAFCYATAWHWLPNPSGANSRTFVGSYDFHLVQLAGQWRIDRFRFNLKFIDGNKDLEKAAGRDS